LQDHCSENQPEIAERNPGDATKRTPTIADQGNDHTEYYCPGEDHIRAKCGSIDNLYHELEAQEWEIRGQTSTDSAARSRRTASDSHANHGQNDKQRFSVLWGPNFDKPVSVFLHSNLLL
jgi:hypothetical protein